MHHRFILLPSLPNQCSAQPVNVRHDAPLMWNITPIPSQSVPVPNPLNVRQTRAVATALVQNQTLALAKGIRRSPLDTAATVPSGTLGFTVRSRYASRPGTTECTVIPPLGAQTGDAPGWQLPSFGNGSTASPGTVANFSAACWFMGVTMSNAEQGGPKTPIGLLSTDAGGTPIHKWVDTETAAKCSQITPTTPTAAGDVGTLFNPMVRYFKKMHY